MSSVLYVKYILALVSYFLISKFDAKLGLSRKIKDIFKIDTMKKSFKVATISFFTIMLIEIIIKFVFGLPDFFSICFLWFTIGLVTALGSGVSNLVSQKK